MANTTITLPAGVTATRGAHQALTIGVALGLFDADQIPPGSYRLVPMGWRYSGGSWRSVGTPAWYMEAEGKGTAFSVYGQLAGTCPIRDLWRAHTKGPGAEGGADQFGDILLSIAPERRVR